MESFCVLLGILSPDITQPPIMSSSTSVSSQISNNSTPSPPPALPDYIQELIDKGVKYIDYPDLNLEKELGSVSNTSLSDAVGLPSSALTSSVGTFQHCVGRLMG